MLWLLQVPEGDYTIPLGQAEVMRAGSDVTLVGWGGQLKVLEKVGPSDLQQHPALHTLLRLPDQCCGWVAGCRRATWRRSWASAWS